MSSLLKILIEKRNILISTLFGVAFLTISVCSAVAIYIVPMYWHVRSELFDGTHDWVYFVPCIPMFVGVGLLYQASKLAKYSTDLADKLIDKMK